MINNMVSIETLGQRAKKKRREFMCLTDREAGIRALQDDPDYWSCIDDNNVQWQYLDDGVVAQHIDYLRENPGVHSSGFLNWIGKFGEKQRAALLEERVRSCRALVALDQQKASLKNIALQQQLEVVKIREAMAAAQFRVYQLNIEAGLSTMAARNGLTLVSDQMIKVADAQNEAAIKLKQEEHRLSEEGKDNDVRRNKEKLNDEVDANLKEARERERLEQQKKDEDYRAKAAAIVDVATAELQVRDKKIERLNKLYDDLEAEEQKPPSSTRAQRIANLTKEIEMVTKDLYG